MHSCDNNLPVYIVRHRTMLLFIVTGRMQPSGKLSVINLLTGQKSCFSPRTCDSLHPFRSNFAGPTGTWFRLDVQNFTSIATEGVNAAPKYQKFPLFGKKSPRRGDSFDRFRKFLGFYTPNYPTLEFQISRDSLNRLRFGQLGRIIPCTL